MDSGEEKKIRVLVVDDSAFARKVLRELVTAEPDMELVGVAHDGVNAIEQIRASHPDVVSLDLVMPELDGVGVLRAFENDPKPPVFVVVSTADEESDLGVAALQAGAFDVVHKSTALAIDRLYDVSKELIEKIRAAAIARRANPRPLRARTQKPASPPRAEHTTLLAIGASTGGPQALTLLVTSLPADFPVPVVIVLHMPVGYTEAFARRLDAESAVHVIEARDNLPLVAGEVVIARAGTHLVIEKNADVFFARLSANPSDSLHRPSVDVLFESAAKAAGSGVLGVVLTGMGSDGANGAAAIHAAGGHVLTESESSCVVYGMPRSVVVAGLSDADAPLDRIMQLIAAYL